MNNLLLTAFNYLTQELEWWNERLYRIIRISVTTVTPRLTYQCNISNKIGNVEEVEATGKKTRKCE